MAIREIAVRDKVLRSTDPGSTPQFCGRELAVCSRQPRHLTSDSSPLYTARRFVCLELIASPRHHSSLSTNCWTQFGCNERRAQRDQGVQGRIDTRLRFTIAMTAKIPNQLEGAYGCSRVCRPLARKAQKPRMTFLWVRVGDIIAGCSDPKTYVQVMLMIL